MGGALCVLVLGTGLAARPAAAQVVTGWSGFAPVPGILPASTAPASATLAGQVFAVVGSSDDRHLYWSARSAPQGPWSPWSVIEGLATELPPAVIAHRGQLLVFAIASADRRILLNRYDPGADRWSGWRDAGGGRTTSTAVAAVSARRSVHLFAALDGEIGLAMRVAKRGRNRWSGWTTVQGGVAGLDAPAAVALGRHVHLFSVAAGSRRIFANVLDSKSGVWSGTREIPGGGTTDRAVAPVVVDDTLMLFGKGIDDRRLYMNTMASSGVWSGWSQVAENLRTATAASAATDGRAVYLFAQRVEDQRLHLNVGTRSNPPPAPTPTGGAPTPRPSATPPPTPTPPRPTPAPTVTPVATPRPTASPVPTPLPPRLTGTLRCIVRDGAGTVDSALPDLPFTITNAQTGSVLAAGTTRPDGSISEPLTGVTGSVKVKVRYHAPVAVGAPALDASTLLKVTDDVDSAREDEVTVATTIAGGSLDLGQVAFRTVDCELWRLGNEVLRDYHRVRQAPPPSGQYHLMRRAGVVTGAGMWAAYDHVPVRTDLLDGAGSGFEHAGRRRTVAFHEFAHTVAFVADGSRSYWDFNVTRWAYGRTHRGDEITNVQYAFMEGWAGYWQHARAQNRGADGKPHPDGFRFWNEDLVTNRLLELAKTVETRRAITADAADAEMIRVLEANPGAIHSLHEFETKLNERLGLAAPPAPPSCPPDWSDDGATCRTGEIIPKPSYQRGAGSVPSSCPVGQERSNGLCYPTCQAGYSGNGPMCWGSCPADYRDDGATCFRDAHIFSKDNFQHGWGGALPCDDDEERSGLLCYPRCPAGYRREAHICWQTTCPAGYHDDGLTCRRDPNAIAKPSYGRGVGSAPSVCGPGREYDTGLCYSACQAGFRGLLTTCLGSCPAGYDDHGGTCYRPTSIIVKF